MFGIITMNPWDYELTKRVLKIHIPSKPCIGPCSCHTSPQHAVSCVNHSERWAKVVFNGVAYCGQCFRHEQERAMAFLFIQFEKREECGGQV